MKIYNTISDTPPRTRLKLRPMKRMAKNPAKLAINIEKKLARKKRMRFTPGLFAVELLFIAQ